MVLSKKNSRSYIALSKGIILATILERFWLLIGSCSVLVKGEMDEIWNWEKGRFAFYVGLCFVYLLSYVEWLSIREKWASWCMEKLNKWSLIAAKIFGYGFGWSKQSHMGNIIYIKYIKCWVVTSRNVKFVEKSRTCGTFFVRLLGCKTTPTVAYQLGYTCYFM